MKSRARRAGVDVDGNWSSTSASSTISSLSSSSSSKSESESSSSKALLGSGNSAFADIALASCGLDLASSASRCLLFSSISFINASNRAKELNFSSPGTSRSEPGMQRI
jgi:hypothetical protein